jgi:ferredoxin--NADP+ reductase
MVKYYLFSGHDEHDEHDLAYTSLIESWSKQYAERFHFVPIVRLENKTNGLCGHIPTSLKSSCIQKQVGLEIHAIHGQIMLCGDPVMIEDAT